MSSFYSKVFWLFLYSEMENIDNTCVADKGLLSFGKNVSNSPSWEYKNFTCLSVCLCPKPVIGQIKNVTR